MLCTVVYRNSVFYVLYFVKQILSFSLQNGALYAVKPHVHVRNYNENSEALQLEINAWIPKAYTFSMFTYFPRLFDDIGIHFPICFIYTYSNHSRDFTRIFEWYLLHLFVFLSSSFTCTVYSFFLLRLRTIIGIICMSRRSNIAIFRSLGITFKWQNRFFQIRINVMKYVGGFK